MTTMTVVHDPHDAYPAGIDWGPWLSSIGETIASAAWAVEDGDGALVIASSSVSGTRASVIATGGTVGSQYRVRCRVTTSPSAYVRDLSLLYVVRQR